MMIKSRANGLSNDSYHFPMQPLVGMSSGCINMMTLANAANGSLTV